jgi:putative nucleotidyltransferase with HDIG domain
LKKTLETADIEPMAFSPNVEEQELLADTLRQEQAGMTARDRLAETLVGTAFAGVATALVLLQPPRAFAIGPALLCFVLLVLATRVRFDTPFGFTVGTQLAFVPLLFVVPVTLVPFAVVAALVMARTPELIAGKTKPSRLLLMVGNSWFAIGPVAVFVLAGVAPINAGPMLLFAALIAQFLVDFTISASRNWIARGAGLSTQLREAWVYGVDAALSGIAIVIAEDVHTVPVAVIAVIPALAVLAMFARERQDRLHSLLELNNAYRGTALVLGDVVEADDGYTGNHCRSVVELALAVGEELELDPERRRNLEFGALLHDVGKIAIPKEIINKPGKLDPSEWTIIKTHTVEGQKMLDRVGGFMRDVGMIVRSHHERWDGGGYPDGLAGEAIPIESRIIACCDAWNAMVTDRPYRRAFSHENALAELRANAGSQFDPRVVAVLALVVKPTTKPRIAATTSPRPRPNIQTHTLPTVANSAS